MQDTVSVTFCIVFDLMAAAVSVATPRVKTWFIVRRLFEPEEPSDIPASGGDGDAAPHVAVKVENAVIDGGMISEVMPLGSCLIVLSCLQGRLLRHSAEASHRPSAHP